MEASAAVDIEAACAAAAANDDDALAAVAAREAAVGDDKAAVAAEAAEAARLLACAFLSAFAPPLHPFPMTDPAPEMTSPAVLS